MNESSLKPLRVGHLTATPICQAHGCDEDAKSTISSQHGHPDGEWKLCECHCEEVDGRDPSLLTNKGWTLRKLYYQCDGCGEPISHNVINEHVHLCLSTRD